MTDQAPRARVASAEQELPGERVMILHNRAGRKRPIDPEVQILRNRSKGNVLASVPLSPV